MHCVHGAFLAQVLDASGLRGQTGYMTDIRNICVYCGSSPGHDPSHTANAYALGEAIGKAGLSLVYGGGTKGLMGAVAQGAMDRGAHVTGIIPRFLMNKEATEAALGRLDELVITEDMHERKHAMFERSDAFVTLPGGIGTLEEVVEIMTWGQLGRHSKPIVLADFGRFWEPLITLLDHMREAGFIHTGHRVKPLVVDRAEAIIPAIMAAAATAQPGDAAVIEKL